MSGRQRPVDAVPTDRTIKHVQNLEAPGRHMQHRLDHARILMYSHDSFGLGHLRRCRKIAHALVDRFKGLTVLVLSGSPIIGSFDFKARVDFVRIPGIIKLYNGEYTPLNLHIDLSQTLAIRESIIRHTAKAFDPHIMLIDKEPMGLHAEAEPTLRMLKQRGALNILGLRDVMDEPNQLRAEWHKKGLMPRINELFDEVWVYGPVSFGNPLDGLALNEQLNGRMHYTGFLHDTGGDGFIPSDWEQPATPYLLVTAGGGGDGAKLMDNVLRAYESGADLMRAEIVYGPFMSAEDKASLNTRIDRLGGHVSARAFEPHIEPLMHFASGVVAMGGYNTFCEILSHDKPALIAPRTQPRQEQRVRATIAASQGILKVLDLDNPDTDALIHALQDLPKQPPPSNAGIDDLMTGLDRMAERVLHHLG